MLDPKYIKENKIELISQIKNRQMDPSIVDEVILLDEKRLKLLQKAEQLRADRNSAAKEQDIDTGKKVKNELQKLEPELKAITDEFEEKLKLVPNFISKDVPVGKDETENKPIRKWGTIPKFSFQPKEHYDIGEYLGIIDTTKSAEVAGSRFSYLMGDLVLMQFAVMQFLFETLTNKTKVAELAKKAGNASSKAFVPVLPPVMAKSEIMKKMDRFDPLEDRYYLETDDLLLIGSAEHTLGPLHMNEIIKEEDLPIRYLGYSTAFRREAGSYGKDTKGILRLHQFDKMEMEAFTTPEQGQGEQNLMVAIQEHLMQSLKIPYQVVAICTGDMGKPDYRQIDIEAWMPGQNKYRETHTSDYMTDYQARRLNIRYSNTKGEKQYVHMNDATASAGRTLIAILENFQQKDGSVKVPEVLQKWMGKDVIKKND